MLSPTLFSRIAFVTTLTLASILPTTANANSANNIDVQAPFAREVPPMAMASASFMTLVNTSDKDIFMVGAHSDVAKRVELHTHTNDNGVMKMRQVAMIKVAANSQTELKPGGFHVMLINPVRHLKKGETVTVTLSFRDGSTKTVSMPVKSLMMKHQMGGMKHMQHKEHGEQGMHEGHGMNH